MPTAATQELKVNATRNGKKKKKEEECLEKIEVLNAFS